MYDCKYFSLALDESTDVMDVSQLLIFTRTIDSTFEVHEELLKLVALHDTTKGTDIFNAVNGTVTKYGGFDKLSACRSQRCRGDVSDSPGSSNRAAWTARYCTASYTRWVTLSAANIIMNVDIYLRMLMGSLG